MVSAELSSWRSKVPPTLWGRLYHRLQTFWRALPFGRTGRRPAGWIDEISDKRWPVCGGVVTGLIDGPRLISPDDRGEESRSAGMARMAGIFSYIIRHPFCMLHLSVHHRFHAFGAPMSQAMRLACTAYGRYVISPSSVCMPASSSIQCIWIQERVAALLGYLRPVSMHVS